ncbi:MAG TPA: hypothetical protein VHK88_16675, partial [Aquihabitans sp.]|nr:hypothetical protein [Aquihabitans sp.]
MSAMAPAWDDVEPLAVPAVAETAEAVIEDLDVRRAASPAVQDGLAQAAEEPSGRDLRDAGMPLVVRVRQNRDSRPLIEGGDAEHAGARRSVSIDDYAKSVLYNGLGHYRAARAAAQRACAGEDFLLLDGALAELVEASVRSGNRDGAVAALRRLQARADATRSTWALGVAACSRALLSDDDGAEANFLEAIERLRRTSARVTLGRAHLLYGEWLRRRAR